MEHLIEIIYSLGTAICHQMDERTFHFNENPLLVCARCTGTYTGFTISFIYWMIINRKLKGGTPPNYAFITAGIFIGTLVIDGGTSYLHLRETNNQIRLITGLLAGSGAAILIVPCIFELLFKYSSTRPFIEKKIHFILWIITIIITFFIVRTESRCLYYPLSFIISSGIILMLSMVNGAVLVLFPPWSSRKIKDIKSFFLFVVPIILLSFTELYLSYSLHMAIKTIQPD